MGKVIDCFFIGHNEMNFVDYQREIRKMGLNSVAYRDLGMNFIQYNNKPYTLPDIFNLFCGDIKPLTLGETFSAAIAYLGTYLHRRGLTFDYVNSFQECKEELAEKLTANEIRTIAIVTTLYVSVFPVLEIMEFIKKYNRTARVIIGGPFVTNQVRTMEPRPMEYLFNSIGADVYVNNSQGEATLVKVINAFKNNTSLDGIDNIYYKPDEAEPYVGTNFNEESNDLSENMVDWDLFADRMGEFAALRTAVSCPFSCSFCGFPQRAGAYRTAGVDAVEGEFDRLRQIPGLKSVNVVDDTFNVPVKRFKEILRMMIRKKITFKWNSHFRCQFGDRETVELMKDAGCEGVFLGIESGSNRILKNMNKAVKAEQYFNGIALLKEYGILTHGSFIIGFPGETEETVDESLNFIKTAGLDFFRAQLWYCDPVTPIWKRQEEFGISGSNYEWKHNTMDARRAFQYMEKIFHTVDTPLWVPQYNFEFDSVFHLIHRGFSLDRIKALLRAFNGAVREKLGRSSGDGGPGDEIAIGAARAIKTACSLDSTGDSTGAGPQNGTEKHDNDRRNRRKRPELEFDF